MTQSIDYKLVAEYAKNEYPQYVEKIISIGNDILKNKFVFDMPWDMERTSEEVIFEDKIQWNYVLNNDLEFMYQLNRHNFFPYLAQCYYYTDNEKYLKKLCDIWWDFLENVPYRKGNTPYRTLEVGIRPLNWLQTIEMIKGTKFLTTSLKEKIDICLKKHVEILTDSNGSFQLSSNWGVIQNSGLFILGAYFKDNDVMTLAINRLNSEANMQILDDGVHWEQSCGYHNAVLFSFLDVIVTALKVNFSLPKEFTEKVKSMALCNVKWIKPHNHQPLLGDSDNNDISDILGRCSLIFDDSTMRYFGTEKLDYDSVFYFGIDGVKKYDSMEKTKPTFKSIELKHSGQLIYRNSFDHNGDYLHFMNGRTGGGHSHADKLSIMLTLDGRDVIVDGGRYTYKNVKERKYIKSAMAHNTPIISGKPFLKPIDAWAVFGNVESNANTFYDDEFITFFEGSHLAYLKKGVVIKRSILIIKPEIFIIVDTFISKKSQKYEEYYHFAPNSTLQINGDTICYKDIKGEVFLHVLGNIKKIEKVKSLYSENYNTVTENNAVKIKAHFKKTESIATVIVKSENSENRVSGKAVSPIKLRSILPVNKSFAQGFQFTVNGDKYTLLLCHNDVRDICSYNDKKAFSRITLYKNDDLIFKYN